LALAQAAREDYGEAAGRFASQVGVTAKHPEANQRLQGLILAPLKNGFPVVLSDTIPVGHGDRYQLWARCVVDKFQLSLMTPPDSDLTKWMNDVWNAALVVENKNK